jgi:hypothetical protein
LRFFTLVVYCFLCFALANSKKGCTFASTKQRNINAMTTTTIKAGTVIKAVSICDSECVFTAEVLTRKGDFVTLKVKGYKDIVRKKVKVGYNGNEYVMALGTYSMAPAFS